MSETLKIRKIGNSLGMILPKALASKMNVEEGDALFVTDHPDGVVLTPYDPEFAEAIEHGRDFMKKYRDTFRELAK